jgi:hypothetical protein
MNIMWDDYGHLWDNLKIETYIYIYIYDMNGIAFFSNQKNGDFFYHEHNN